MDRDSRGPMTLYYRQPAEAWLHALPVGNGRLGAMIFGGVPEERLQLNEETVWAGSQRYTTNPAALAHLPTVRELLAEGRYEEADQLADKFLLGEPRRMKPYQTLGDLRLSFDGHEGVTNYCRELDLATGVARVSYRLGYALYEREVFCSAVDDVLVVHCRRTNLRQSPFLLKSGWGRGMRIIAALDRPADFTVVDLGDALAMRGKLDGGAGVDYEVRVQALTEDGSVSIQDGALVVEEADEVTFVLAAATSFRDREPSDLCAERLAGAERKPYDTLRDNHTADHRRLFERFTLRLDGDDRSEMATDERLAAVRDGAEDPGLLAQYLQYGRYLLIASSRPGTQPATLQGLWNDRLDPPWNCCYTTNINLQMNYWPAEATNLAECHTPLFDHLEAMRASGRRTARVHYGAKGVVLHHINDIWGWTTPSDGVWGLWPTGYAWLCQHLWEHYQHSGDRTFLERAYPTLKEASEFFLGYLVEDADGHLVSGPSASPENRFATPSGGAAYLSMGPSMDQQIIAELLEHTVAAAEALGVDEELRARLAATRAKLLPPRVGRHGQLQEWAEDFDEAEPGHRHLSHLYGFYPGAQFTLRGTPELAAAVRNSLERRLAHGGGQTGWSRAWVAALWARFEEGDLAHDSLYILLRESTEANLFDLHPPVIFQIDGNLGATAAATEMLCQSHAGELALLPALPRAWHSGEVTGLRARGGWTVNLTWRDAELASATIRSSLAGPCRLRTKARVNVASGGQRVPTTPNADGTLTFETRAGGSYDITPA